MNKILKSITSIIVLGLMCEFAAAVSCRVCSWNQAHRISDNGASFMENACDAAELKDQNTDCSVCYWHMDGESHSSLHVEGGITYNVSVPAGFTTRKGCQPEAWSEFAAGSCVMMDSSQGLMRWRSIACFCGEELCNTVRPSCAMLQRADPTNPNIPGCEGKTTNPKTVAVRNETLKGKMQGKKPGGASSLRIEIDLP